MKKYHRAVQQQFLCFVGAKVAGFLVVVRVVVTGRRGILVWSERERETRTERERSTDFDLGKGGFCE